jgi:hypothetical protein
MPIRQSAAARLRRGRGWLRIRIAAAMAMMVWLPAGEPLQVVVDQPAAAVRFAQREILQAAGPDAVDWRITFAAPDRSLPPQCYDVALAGDRHVRIAGGDDAGLMYGGLEVAEAIRHGGMQAIRASSGRPAIAARGIKFNIPLDARTPSYSDAGDSAQATLPEVWKREFWSEFLDEMARHRFNVLSLWNFHPFPSLVRVPEYPDVALADVKRMRHRLDEGSGAMGRELFHERHFEDLETVHTMSIDQKIAFWREVMGMAADRGIAVYWFTWNIYAYGAAGHHGITHAQDNPITIDYYRASVRELIRTYPLLAGIGITAGERVEQRDDEFAIDRWLWRAYGEGVRDGLRDSPQRPFRVIHRFHEASLASILANWRDLPCTFETSYKYSVARMYSHHAPPFINEVLPRMPAGLKTWLTVRNDDIYDLRWGDPAYARAYVTHMPGPDRLAGFYIGADGDTWGRDAFSTEPDDPPQLYLSKHWYSLMLWGRLAYDPTLPDARFAAALAARFPGVDGARLAEAMAEAGRIIPQLNRFYWNDIDLKWTPETCQSHPTFRWGVKGFHTVAHIAAGQPMPGTRIMSISDFVKGLRAGRAATGQTPPEVVAALRGHAHRCLELLAGLGDRAAMPKELRLTVGDQEAMARLGLYYADKIAGALSLAMLSASGEERHRGEAVAALESALGHWQAYVTVATSQYRPRRLARSMPLDLAAVTPQVRADIERARTWKARRP